MKDQLRCSKKKLLELNILKPENGEYRLCKNCKAENRTEAINYGCRLYAVLPAHMIGQLNEGFRK